MLDGAVPLSSLVLSGAVVAITVLLWALYRWTRFGLATRAASENDVAARLAGLSPNELSLANTLHRQPPARHARHLRRLGGGARHDHAAVPGRAGTRRRPLRQAHLLRDRLRLRPRHRDARVADRARIDEVVVPDQRGRCRGPASRSCSSSRSSWRRCSCAARRCRRAASWSSSASRTCRARSTRSPSRSRRRSCARVALVVLPFDFRQALTNSLIGIVMALSLVVITGFVGQISVVQLALAGVAGFTVSHLAVDAGIGFPLAPLAGIAAAVAARPRDGGVGAARARGGARGRDDRRRGRRLQLRLPERTWGGGATGSPVPDPHLFGHQPRPDRVVTAASTGTCPARCSAGSRLPPPCCSACSSSRCAGAPSGSACSRSAPTSAPRPGRRSTSATSS